MAILSSVERWDTSKADPTASISLHRAGQLLHYTTNENAHEEIKYALFRIFGQWQQSFTIHPSAPVQVRFLLITAMERGCKFHYISCLAVLSSPHFSDALFKDTLREYLIPAITDGRDSEKQLAMLSFCVLCAIDKEATLKDSFDLLRNEFIEVGTPMIEMWELVMPQTSAEASHPDGFGGNRGTMTNLKNYLRDLAPEVLGAYNRSWAIHAIDKALEPQETTLYLSREGHINREENGDLGATLGANPGGGTQGNTNY